MLSKGHTLWVNKCFLHRCSPQNHHSRTLDLRLVNKILLESRGSFSVHNSLQKRLKLSDTPYMLSYSGVNHFFYFDLPLLCLRLYVIFIDYSVIKWSRIAPRNPSIAFLMSLTTAHKLTTTFSLKYLLITEKVVVQSMTCMIVQHINVSSDSNSITFPFFRTVFLILRRVTRSTSAFRSSWRPGVSASPTGHSHLTSVYSTRKQSRKW